MEIIWKDPPPKKCTGRPPGRTAAFVEALKTRPGQWALYISSGSKSSGNASAFKKRYPGTEWTTRQTGGGKADLYGRWIGTDAA